MKPISFFRAVAGEPLSTSAREMAWRLVWFVAIATAIAYASYLFFGSIITAEVEERSAIVGIDVIRAGEHYLSGIVLVPTNCDLLSVETRRISDTSYELAFTTWQEPARNCARSITPRSFEEVVFAPSIGVSFSATLDGTPVTLKLISRYK